MEVTKRFFFLSTEKKPFLITENYSGLSAGHTGNGIMWKAAEGCLFKDSNGRRDNCGNRMYWEVEKNGNQGPVRGCCCC